MAKRFNSNQKILYKALETISTGILYLEDAVNVVDKMSKEEIDSVIGKFEDKIDEFNLKDIYSDAYNLETYAQDIISGIETKLKEDE